MYQVIVKNIRPLLHLADIACEWNMPCTWHVEDVDVRAYCSYETDPEGQPDPKYVRAPCPMCGQVTVYPTFDPKNYIGWQLGQAMLPD